jgi:Kef-type K+ transport system membrane component KefB
MNTYRHHEHVRTRMIGSTTILVFVFIFVMVLMVLGIDVWAAILAAGAIGTVSATIAARLFGDPGKVSELPPTPELGPGIDTL